MSVPRIGSARRPACYKGMSSRRPGGPLHALPSEAACGSARARLEIAAAAGTTSPARRCDGGLISTCPSGGVHVARERAAPGKAGDLGDYNRGLTPRSRRTGGVVSQTGCRGLTLGGGSAGDGKHGMGGQPSRVELVTALRRIRASADEHPDLFWALRGGGGNLGSPRGRIHCTRGGRCHRRPRRASVRRGARRPSLLPDFTKSLPTSDGVRRRNTPARRLGHRWRLSSCVTWESKRTERRRCHRQAFRVAVRRESARAVHGGEHAVRRGIPARRVNYGNRLSRARSCGHRTGRALRRLTW